MTLDTSSRCKRGKDKVRNPPRILAVDDVPENLEIVRMRLQAHGYEVVTAVDGEEALAKSRTLAPTWCCSTS